MNRTLTLLYVLMTAGVQAVSAAVPEHGYVDLGLSVMWADANVGADSQSAPGTYFIWDGQDHAAMEWGGPWRTPSKREWDELLDNCSFVWTDDRDGASGYIVTSCVPGFEGRSMFIPAAGCLDNGHTAQVNEYGSYWTMDGCNSRSAFAYNFDSSTREWHTDLCTVGQSIRAVRDVDGRQTGRLGLYLEGDDGRADGRTLDLESGYSYRLLAGSTERCVSAACRWSSSNPSVASVTPDGVVFALSSGTATITAQVLDRKTACRVRVMDVEMESVDLGLTMRWAVRNLGASSATETGYRFAFGETVPKTWFDWNNYSLGSKNQLFKYDRIPVQPEDDAVRAHLGEDWRLPDVLDICELECCNWEWTDSCGTPGVKLSGFMPGLEDRSIFIPATGYIDGEEPVEVGEMVNLWSSSVNGQHGIHLEFDIDKGPDFSRTHGNPRISGECVRGVTRLKESDFDSIRMSADSITLGLYGKYIPSAHFIPERLPEGTVYNRSFCWESSDTSVAFVTEYGEIVGVGAGRCRVSAFIGSKRAECTVTVIDTGMPAVDLGLSVEWAACNIGAFAPDEPGAYYDYVNANIVEGKLADGWRIPTDDEMYELLRTCNWQFEDGRGWIVTGGMPGFEDAELVFPISGAMESPHLWNPLNSSLDSYVELDNEEMAVFRFGKGEMFCMDGEGNTGLSSWYNDEKVPMRCVRTVPGRKPAIENAVNIDDIPECEYVDLGLSVLWATSNIGASCPAESGELFAWGETSPKFNYTNLDRYKYPELQDSVLMPDYDAATASLGPEWRIPTESEWQELLDSCTWTVSENGNVEGCLVTSNVSGYEGRSIFLPFVSRVLGYDFGSLIKDDRWGGCSYWSSSTDESWFTVAIGLDITLNNDIPARIRSSYIYYGQPVRPVRNK